MTRPHSRPHPPARSAATAAPDADADADADGGGGGCAMPDDRPPAGAAPPAGDGPAPPSPRRRGRRGERARRLEEAAFLAALRRTGNVREAARSAGANRATLFRRRAADPAFAAEWAAAVTLAAAGLARAAAGGGAGGGTGGGDAARDGRANEPETVRRHNGRLQLRVRPAGHLTPRARTAFLAALSATANVRLSAAAAGHSHAAFYGLRNRDEGFAREWRLALQQGFDALELALIAATAPGAVADDAWRHNAPPATPPMTVAQALQLLHLHHKEARLGGEPRALRRRPGESRTAHLYRLDVMAELREARRWEAACLAAAARAAGDDPGRHAPPPPALPDLAQVTGWSGADPAATPHDPDRALFGGWRVWNLPDWDDGDWSGRQWGGKWGD